MKPLKMSFLFYTIVAMLITSCTVTTTKIKDPVFSESMDSIQTNLNKLITCQNINLNGKEITTNGKTRAELEIDVNNGQNVPAGEIQMDALGKSIAQNIKKALKDQNEYNQYTVLFVTKENSGAITKSTWKGKAFKSEEL